MHKTAERLYLAAQQLKRVKGQSQIARLLNESPQTIKNWETRGVSRPGALKAQDSLGVSATWLLDGKGAMVPGAEAAVRTISGESIFDAMTPEERQFLENFRTLTDHDRERYAGEIDSKAQEMRDYLAKHLQRAGLPTPKSAAERAKSLAAKTTADVTQRALLKDGEKQK